MWLGAFCPLSLAQQLPAEIQENPPIPDLRPEAHQQGVYLNDSFEAKELLSLARNHVQKREWDQAIAKLEETYERCAGKVMKIDDGIYTSVVHKINLEIASWPAEGLASYCARFEDIARKAHAEALQERDWEKLGHVIAHYYCTTSGLQACHSLAELYIEDGKFGSAHAIYQQLLTSHPDRMQHTLELQSKQAICLALQGKATRADNLLVSGGTSLEQHPITWQGQVVPCQQVVAEIEAMPLKLTTDYPAQPLSSTSGIEDNWPTFAGNSQRNAVPELDELPTAPLWFFRDFSPTTLSRGDSYFQNSSYRSALNRGKFLAFFPTVSCSLVFFHDATHVWALSEDTGQIVWTFEGIPSSSSGSGWQDRSVPSLHSCSVLNDRVFVELGNRPVSYYGYQASQTQSILVCLEARTGDLIWKTNPSVYGEDQKEVQFEGPVLADKSGIFIVVRRRKAFGFEDSYLWKFSVDGEMKWRAHLGSASTGGFGYRYPTLAIPTLIDNQVYVQSNLGTIASINANTGLVDWISVYDRPQAQGQSWRSRSNLTQILPWQYNPILMLEVSPRNTTPDSKSENLTLPGPKLIALPLDINDLLILDAANGKIVSRHPKNELHGVQSLLGIIDGKLFAVGEQIFCWNTENKTTVWSAPLTENPVYGRAALSSTRVFVPTLAGLLSYSHSGGQPELKQWNPQQDGGNVLILADRVLTAGNDHVTAYGLRDNVFARLQSRMELDPDNPLPALELAEVAYRTASAQPQGPAKQDDYDRGRSALDEALRRAGGFAGSWDPQFKQRLFQDCLLFAELALAEADPDLDAALELLIMAGQCPPNSESLLLQKAKLANAYLLKEDYENAIRQYRFILSDRSLRDLDWPETSAAQDTIEPAHKVSRHSVAKLIAQHGRKIYKAFDDQANTLLAAARQTLDLKRLNQIITTMPNSLSAPQALLLKGDLLRDRQNNPIAAARSFYVALVNYPDHINQAQTIRQIADSYLRADKPEVAWQWLSKGARQHPKARVSFQNRMLTLTEYRDTLGLSESLGADHRPQLGISLTRSFSLPKKADTRLLYPQFLHRDDILWSSFLIYQEGQITACTNSTGDSVWAGPIDVHQTTRLLAQLENITIVSTRHEILALNPHTGKILWQHGQIPQKLNDPESDPEDFPYWKQHQLHDHLLFNVRSDGQASCLDIYSGQELWQNLLDHMPDQVLSLGEHFIIYNSTDGDRQFFPVLSTSQGQLLHLIELSDSSPAQGITQTLAGNALISTTQSLSAVDPLKGNVEWEIEFDGNLITNSIQLVLDGVILSTDGIHVVKLNLDDGEQMWKSEPFGSRTTELDMLATAEELYVSNEHRVFSLDLTTGRRLAEILPPHDTYLTHMELTENHLVMIFREFPREGAHTDFWAVIEKLPVQLDHEAQTQNSQALGKFAGPMQFYIYDHAIIGFDENSLHGWTNSLD